MRGFPKPPKAALEKVLDSALLAGEFILIGLPEAALIASHKGGSII